jgi:hypothetical protein
MTGDRRSQLRPQRGEEVQAPLVFTVWLEFIFEIFHIRDVRMYRLVRLLTSVGVALRLCEQAIHRVLDEVEQEIRKLLPCSLVSAEGGLLCSPSIAGFGTKVLHCV